jgi:hypothetical protein
MLGSMRWRLAAGLGLGLGFTHACGDGGFACDDDEQCTLAGTAGRCVDGGRCAYPNEECASGLAYPQGAPQGLAGECVPSDAVGSGTGGETTASAEPGSSESSSGRDTEAADDESSSGDPMLCDDPHEPNDDAMVASAIPFGAAQGCNAMWEGTLEDARDSDWFVLDTSDGACMTGTELTFVTDPPLQLCAVPSCADVTQAEILACDGEVLPLATGTACCAFEQLHVLARCGDAPAGMVLGIAAAAASPACLPYQAVAFL